MDSLSYSFKGLAKKAAIRSRAWSDSEKGFLLAFYLQDITYIKLKRINMDTKIQGS